MIKNGYLLAILALILSFASFSQAAPAALLSDAKKSEYIQILKRAEAFSASQKDVSDMGSLFLKHRFTPQHVREEDFLENDAFNRVFGEKYAIKNLKIKRRISSEKEIDKVIKSNEHVFNNYFYGFPKKVQRTLVHAFDDVLIKALYCDKSGYDNLDLAILLKMRDNIGGYADTHGLLGLLFLEGNQCLDSKRLKKAKDSFIESIIKALEKDEIFSDIYAERVACLYWAGAGARVKPEWIEKIAQSQRPDGGWASPGRLDSSLHTAGLAALSMRYFLTGEEPYCYKK